MSIASEITRLQGVKSDILTAIGNKGVTVPAGSALDDCPDLIADITGSVIVGSELIGGRTYKTISFGAWTWLAENLDYKFIVNGHQIPIGGSGVSGTPTAWYYNNNETDYGIDGTYKCGLLYNGYAATYLENNKATLIPGWHVPSSNEWDILGALVGGASTAGTVLKAIDSSATAGYPSDWNGTDIFSFSVLPTGEYDGTFHSFGISVNYWTITPIDDYLYRCHFDNGAAMATSGYNYKGIGRPIRLVKD